MFNQKNKNSKWLAQVTGFKKNDPLTMKDYLVTWVPQFPFLGHLESVEEFLQEPAIPNLSKGDIVIGHFGKDTVLAQCNGNGFNEIERTVSPNYAWRWRHTILSMFDLKKKSKAAINPVVLSHPEANINQVFVSSGTNRAKALFDGTKFTLLKMSEISKKIDLPSFKWYPSQLKKMKQNKALNDHPLKGDKYILLKDVVCSSPSAAASIVAGGSVSGNDFWKHEKTNTKLKDLK